MQKMGARFTVQIHFIDMMLVPMYQTLAPVLPAAAAMMTAGLQANRARWQQLGDSGADNHAVIADSETPPELFVSGGQAIDPMFDEYALLTPCALCAHACVVSSSHLRVLK